ncbi:recombinase family protein [Candidatus Parcubacteria bacterium]|nr:recombinase family protein [Candidatus Parcubacteria bacterium]
MNDSTKKLQSYKEITEQTKEVVPAVRYCLYARKSTESDEQQALSIDSQINEMTNIAIRDNLNITEIRKESHSAKDSGQRPVFNQLIKDIRNEMFDGILTWAPDRLSRNAGDLGSLVDLMDQKKLLKIKTYGQNFSNSPNEKFLLMILCSQAKLENDNKSINVKRGLRTRCEMGLRPGIAPTGYLNEKRTDRRCHVLVDVDRSYVISQMYEKVANENWSGRKVFHWLKDDIDFKTKNGKHLTLSNVYIILKNTFYHGRFEYPVGSGNWYTGQHKPLVSRDLFEKVQKQLNRGMIVRSESKEFAFTKLIKCGLCGSGVTAEDKYKQRKDGSRKKYIYYGCTRFNDKKCKCGYVQEKDLLEQLIKILDKIDLDQIGMKRKIELEIERYNKFRFGVLGMDKKEKNQQKDVDIRNYAKYILKEGNVYEKRELLECLKSKLVLNDKKLYLS